jgi:hypothetical protein
MKINKLLAVALLGTAVSVSAQTVAERTIGTAVLLAGWDFNGVSAGTASSINARYSTVYTPAYVAGLATNGGSSTFGTLSLNNTNGATFGSARPMLGSSQPVYDIAVTEGLSIGNESLGDVTTNSKSLVLSASNALNSSARAVFKVSSLSTSNSFTDLNVAYSALNQGTSAGAISWSYSLDGSTFTAISGTSASIAGSAASAVFTADFSAISAIEGVTEVYLGLNYTEAAQTASVVLDNVAIYGTAAAIAIPEPSAFATLAGVAALGLVAARRRRSAK